MYKCLKCGHSQATTNLNMVDDIVLIFAGRDTQVSLNNQGEPRVHQDRSPIRPPLERNNATGQQQHPTSDGTRWDAFHSGDKMLLL